MVAPARDGAIGPSTAPVLSLATAAPPHRQASISRSSVQRRDKPIRRAASQAAPVTAAASINGQLAGSLPNAK
ncbi:hypothetical protein D3C80_1965390 [compost metagenome]